MHPILFTLGPITIYTYGVLVAAGFLIALLYARRQAPRAGLDPHKIWNVCIYGILVALLISKLWLVFSEWNFFVANPGLIFSVSTWQAGGTFYGGFLGGILWVVLYCHFKELPFWGVLDLLAPALALGHGIGRLGCFAAGCCYGKPTSLPWGVKFSSPVAQLLAGTPLGVSLHPTQLYEAAAEFLNFVLLVLLSARLHSSRPPATVVRHGRIMGAYFILYGIERGAIEFFRGDPGRTLMFHDAVSLMQLVSIAFILAGAFLWWRALRPATPRTVL